MQALQPMLNDSTSFMSSSVISKSNNYEVNNLFLLMISTWDPHKLNKPSRDLTAQSEQ